MSKSITLTEFGGSSGDDAAAAAETARGVRTRSRSRPEMLGCTVGPGCSPWWSHMKRATQRTSPTNSNPRTDYFFNRCPQL